MQSSCHARKEVPCFLFAQEDASSDLSSASNAADAKKRLERLRDQRHQKQLTEADPQKQVGDVCLLCGGRLAQ